MDKVFIALFLSVSTVMIQPLHAQKKATAEIILTPTASYTFKYRSYQANIECSDGKYTANLIQERGKKPRISLITFNRKPIAAKKYEAVQVLLQRSFSASIASATCYGKQGISLTFSLALSDVKAGEEDDVFETILIVRD
jgi:hypothetical protein